jgi:hypothetical protein
MRLADKYEYDDYFERCIKLLAGDYPAELSNWDKVEEATRGRCIDPIPVLNVMAQFDLDMQIAPALFYQNFGAIYRDRELIRRLSPSHVHTSYILSMAIHESLAKNYTMLGTLTERSKCFQRSCSLVGYKVWNDEHLLCVQISDPLRSLKEGSVSVGMVQSEGSSLCRGLCNRCRLTLSLMLKTFRECLWSTLREVSCSRSYKEPEARANVSVRTFHVPDELYLRTGNVVVHVKDNCGAIFFRLHSEGPFRRIQAFSAFLLNAQETYEGCPVVKLSGDAVEDVRHFFLAAHDPW